MGTPREYELGPKSFRNTKAFRRELFGRGSRLDSTDYWGTQDGPVLHHDDITDDHLYNIVRFMHKHNRPLPEKIGKLARKRLTKVQIAFLILTGSL